ncbi:MAG: hypothetical protein E7046_10190 [Lentisphaerae bacterium]|nr:hypothetical protein [Lentisphaerota bacterium]
MKTSGITRRGFLIDGATAFAAAGMPRFVAASDATGASLPLIGSAPVLMNPAERTMDVVFAVNGDASGWVEISKSPDMERSVRVYSGEGPVMRVNGKFAVVRIKGIRPATRYWYRIGADRIELERDYKPWNRGSEIGGRIYSFETLGAESGGSFCVMQDTHSVHDIVDQVFAKIAALKPSAIVWNGDARNFYRTVDDAVGTFLKPHPNHPAYAAETPIMFLNGNHDYRGRFALHLEDLVPFRDAAERRMQYMALGRNFVQRLGDVALIGLDTGEDKQDANPRMGGIFRMTKYRKLQTSWLAEAIETPTVKTAKFKVAFCHIPLFDPNPKANPGDVLPDDDDPRYKHPWAAWQRTCANMWGPLFAKAGVQLVCTGHQHRYRYDAPSAERPWTHIVGGQRDVIEGRVDGGRLVVKVHDCENGRIVFDKEFE